MSNPKTNQSEETSLDKQKQGRRMMLMIVAVFVLPFFITPFLKSPDQLHKTNKGILVTPHIPLADLQLTQSNDQPFLAEQLNTHWTLLYVIPKECDALCAQARDHALYAMRQVRLSLDRDMDRVQQLVIFIRAPDNELSALLAKEFSTMQTVNGIQQVLEETLLSRVKDGSSAGNIFLMSPDGYIFMAYPTFSDESESILRARDIRADLKKSIKGDRSS